MITACCVLFQFCSKPPLPESEVKTVIYKWAGAIEKNDYRLYSKYELTPDDKDYYNEKYENHYPKNFVFFKIDNPIEVDIDNKVFIKTTVNFQCDLIPRKIGIVKKTMKGTMDIVRETNADYRPYLIAEMTTITYDEK